ncbi:hypothetical protein MMC26_002490 [Xylographa opegraphella]|nr:hypothetical protein [Xylographa opegraphella]
MPLRVRKSTRASKVSRPSRNTSGKISQVPQTPISELILHPDAERMVRLIREKYGDPVSILPVDKEELFCVCVSVESRYAGGMVECTNGNPRIILSTLPKLTTKASKCLARWFHLSCIGMTVPPGEDDDWYCTRCIQHQIGRASEWFDRLCSSLGGQLQDTTLEQTSDTSAVLSNTISNNAFAYLSGLTAPPITSQKSVPMTVDLPIRGIRGNPYPAPEGLPDGEDLVIGDATDSPDNNTRSEETETLEKDSTIIQGQRTGVRLGQPRTDRTRTVRRESSNTKQHTGLRMRTTDDSMYTAGCVSMSKYSNDYSASTDPVELYEHVSDGYLAEESDVSNSGDP